MKPNPNQPNPNPIQPNQTQTKPNPIQPNPTQTNSIQCDQTKSKPNQCHQCNIHQNLATTQFSFIHNGVDIGFHLGNQSCEDGSGK